MRPVTITIRFDTDATAEEVEAMAAAAAVQILEPANAEGDDAEFVTGNVHTDVTA
jgi:hypothetical protein